MFESITVTGQSLIRIDPVISNPYQNRGVRGVDMQIDSVTLLYRQIVERAQDAVIFSDREGLIRLWNSGAERKFGYLAEEALGRTLDIIIPEQLRERHWQGYRKVMSIGRSGSIRSSRSSCHQKGWKSHIRGVHSCAHL